MCGGCGIRGFQPKLPQGPRPGAAHGLQGPQGGPAPHGPQAPHGGPQAPGLFGFGFPRG